MQGYVFRMTPPRETFMVDMTDDERAVMSAHVAYWSELAERGVALAFGPVADPAGGYGVGIILAESDDEAQSLRREDPAILSGRGFDTQIAPMLRLVTREGVFNA